jgi:hypothetical protein
MNMTRKSILVRLAAVAAIAVFIITGCTSNHLVPKTKIHWNKSGASIELPKDMEADNITVSKATNGVSIDIKGIKVRTNPDVVGASGTAQADAISAAGNVALKAFEAGKKSITGQ